MVSTAIGAPAMDIAVFGGLVALALYIDLHTHKKDEEISLKSAVYWSLFWVFISLVFAAFLYWHHGSEVASLFIAGYALEKMLSVDNLFVFSAIFSWFAIPNILRHRVLYWGIIGAIIFRLIFVLIGTSLLALGPWVEVLFAVLVGYSGVAMLKNRGHETEIEDYSNHLAYRLVKRFFPIFPKLVGHKFMLNPKEFKEEQLKPENSNLSLVNKAGYYVTPLFLCVAIIELSDIMFAFDSVPAVIAISKEPLIVYSAMMFAILGLRTLYFVLEALKARLIHLDKAIIALLFFIALKLLLAASEELIGVGLIISPNISLLIVLLVLCLGVAASFLFKPSEKK